MSLRNYFLCIIDENQNSNVFTCKEFRSLEEANNYFFEHNWMDVNLPLYLPNFINSIKLARVLSEKFKKRIHVSIEYISRKLK